ncbi:MAG TPA: glycosyltransferase [Thermoanaerobaculia bacterium]|nr:glycosyltransferase [Thermoanaerobaculia bacterium]
MPTATRLAVILVHYHTPELAASAVAALRRDLDGTDVEAEWLLIDNGSDAPGRELLRGLGIPLLDAGRNLGYAGGVNLGVASTSAELILVMNPDVFVLPGCVSGLVDCLQRGAAAAGPRFYWDGGRRFLLPPAERRSRRDELLAWLAGRSPRWAARARRRSRQHARRHWQAEAPLPSCALSGGLLAFTRAAWDRVGRFDEGFPLYFEETDWLLRLRRRGLAAYYQPAAEAVHLHGCSAAVEPRSRQWFELSARRFRRLHYGVWFAAALELLDRSLPRRAPPLFPKSAGAFGPEGLDLSTWPPPLWVELSPNPTGFPAAAERFDVTAGRRWQLAPELSSRLPAAPLALWLSDGAGRDLASWALQPASLAVSEPSELSEHGSAVRGRGCA